MNKSESKYFNTATKMDLALISLLKKKSFSYISVRELCETAGVNRSTFYLHYETMGDLLDETVRYLTDRFLAYFSSEETDIALRIPAATPQELNFICDRYLTPYLTFICDNKEIFSTVLSNGTTFGFEALYKQLFLHIFDPILAQFQYPQSDRKYVMQYYLNGITAIITEWLKDNCEKSISDISHIIQICIFGLNHN